MTKKVSIDVGNGLTCAAMLYKNKWELLSFPSIRTSVDRAGGFDDDKELDLYHWDLDMSNVTDPNLMTSYVVGDQAHRKAGFTEADRSFERYADEFDVFMINVALVKLSKLTRGLNKKDEIELVVCVPPAYMSDQIRSKYNDLVGVYNIYLNDESTPYQYTICSVDVIEEGRGALFAFGIGLDGKPNQYFGELVAGRKIRLVDIGYRTIDSYVIDNGRIADISRYGMTEDYGIYLGVVQPILHKLHAKGGDYSAISEHDIELAIRAYAQGRIDQCGLYIGTDWIQLFQIIQRQVTDYERNVRSRFIESNVITKGMRGINYLLMVGGGGSLMENITLGYYPKKLIEVKKHPVTCGIPDAHIYLNAIGNYLWMIAQENK